MEKVIKAIKDSSHIGITFHQSPDGDSIGSSLALLQGLRTLGKQAYIISKEEVPSTFSYLLFSGEVGLITEVKKETDLLIVLDCGDVKRINAELDLDSRSYKVINIDHHVSNEKYGDLNYVNTKAAAVGEIIYDLLLNLKVKITREIGEAIYTSLLTDTSSFKHSNTTNKTHEVAGALIDCGINFNKIQRRIFENKEFNKVKFFGKVIDTIHLILDGKVAFMEINDKMLQSCNLESVDSSEVIHFGTMISDVEVVALFKEGKDGVKVSLRSKEFVDVNKIALSFNGGGHVRAAGLFYEGALEEIKHKLAEMLKDELR